MDDNERARLAFRSTRTETDEEEWVRCFLGGLEEGRASLAYEDATDDPYARGYNAGIMAEASCCDHD